jgi:hypothetical protein
MIKRRSLDVVFLLVSAMFIPAAAEQQKFAGTWQATFKGEVFMTLKLQEGDPISGSLSGGHIDVDREGEITEASGGGAEHPVSNVKLEGDTLSFDLKEDDDETMKFVMKITGNGEAELQFVNLPEDVKMKPIKLTKP